MTDSATPAPLPPELVTAVLDLDLPQRHLDDMAAAPDSVGDVLLEAAGEMRETDPDSARAVLGVLREHAPQDDHRQYAAHMLSQILRAQGSSEEADRIISDLLRPGVLGRGMAAVLAEEYAESDPDTALYCYNVACRSILAQPAEIVGQLDPLGLVLLTGRARVRERLGHAPDAHDEQASAADASGTGVDTEMEMLDRAMREGSEDEGDDAPAVYVAYDRAFLDQAQERGLITDPGAHHHDVERALRSAARETPGTALHTATATPDQVLAYALAADLDPADPGTRDQWARTLDADALSSWPPERNQACWCGSGRKYKKCCGAPSVR
ncbi:SEC-C domain-containing protein [Nocardiopsis sp. HNM0947]|uniref:SEC-C domain-containing protein n=1 Tax=Nocardiopsis coralli TaxID=2772213 RepID=A0ABR9P1J3_9ACTN|nr:SEC-C domain-containing protein [Nocardiopsis coralli]MBE2997708.1 SEC-C domain-containing protein [Nocardiopsis coralli]